LGTLLVDCSIRSAQHWSDVERGIAEVARVVRPNGRLILAELRPASPIIRFGRGLTSASHRGALEAREWRMLLQNGGFAAVNVAGTGLGARLVLLLTARRANEAALDGSAPTTDSGGVA
jgi:SAM-dependent methyltransferase